MFVDYRLELNFNFNLLSNGNCLMNFWFDKTILIRWMKMFEWPGATAQSKYWCNNVTATCIEPTTKWSNVDRKFGILDSQVSKTFLEMVKRVTEKHDYVVQF